MQRTRFFLAVTWLLWFAAIIGLVVWALWIGGGATEASSWEFFSWLGGPMTAIIIGLCGFTIFVFTSERTAEKKETTPWPRREVRWTWSFVCLLVSGLLIVGVIGGGAAQNWALQLKESRASQIKPPETPEETTKPLSDDSTEDITDTVTNDATEDTRDELPEESPSSESTPATTSLPNLPTTTSTHHYDTGTVEIAGRTYNQSAHLTQCSLCAVEYVLSKDWATFEAVIGLADDSREGAQVTFRVYADSTLIHDATLSRNETKEVSVEVEGTLHLKLEAERLDSLGGTAVWADPTLIR